MVHLIIESGELSFITAVHMSLQLVGWISTENPVKYIII